MYYRRFEDAEKEDAVGPFNHILPTVSGDNVNEVVHPTHFSVVL
jgi:hypothetical protein